MESEQLDRKVALTFTNTASGEFVPEAVFISMRNESGIHAAPAAYLRNVVAKPADGVRILMIRKSVLKYK